jgi:hypothetical protein
MADISLRHKAQRVTRFVLVQFLALVGWILVQLFFSLSGWSISAVSAHPGHRSHLVDGSPLHHATALSSRVPALRPGGSRPGRGE